MSSSPTAPSPTSPPATPSAPPPSNSTAPPPATPSAPPPANATSPPPATPSAPPPATPSAPPPAIPSAPPPAIPSAPPPATPSAPPPSNSTSSPPSSSPPPPATPSVSPPTPSTPSTPAVPSPPAPGGRSPPSGHSPPSAKTPPSTKSPPSPPSNSISTTAVVGIAVGAVVILAVLSLICVCCFRKKKRRRAQPEEEYYGRPPPPLPQTKDDPYGGQPQNWQHNAPPPANHIVKIPPQPTPPPPHASRPPQFPTPPPPPPPIYSSGGGSGSNYSGSEILPPPSPGFSPAFSNSKSTFTFEELALATNGFSDANLLGQGGFGYVHKGVLPNGKEVAIKQLKAGSGQGEREFQAEVEIISRVHHRHLVSLVGYCMSGFNRLLVYEYVPNKTLEFHLHGKDRPTMDWPTRLKIALGSAKGLAYLHEDCNPKIIHRDIKAANILLDFKFEAKVADFGLAKFASDNNTHVSTRVMGTFGYLAPEYAASGKLTDRSDVFSFGVMLLELITGKRPVDSTHTFVEDSLVDWARPLLTRAMEDGNYDALIDPQLGRNYNPNEMERMVACAASCIRHSARHRPRMSQIVRALEGDVSMEDLNEGIRPGHSRPYGASYGSSDYDSNQYNEDMKKFRKMALASRDYASSEYSAPTSEYGQIPSASSSEGQQTREMEMGKMKKDSQGFSSGGK